MFGFLKNMFSAPAAPKPQAVSPVADLREAGRHAVEHMDAMAELLSIELREYVARLKTHAELIIAAVLAAGVTWLLLSALGVWLLQSCWGWGWALFAVAALNALILLALKVIIDKSSTGDPAPLTCREVKNDWQCLKLLINGNKK